jgi:hypothetical protein
MVARIYVEGSGTLTGLKAIRRGLDIPVLHDVRKEPEALNLLMVLFPAFEAYIFPEESNAMPTGALRLVVIEL